MDIFCNSMGSRLRDVLLRHPRDAFKSQTYLAENWKRVGYTACPDFDQACKDYDELIRILEKVGVRVHLLTDPADSGMDSIYVHDPVTTVGDGMVVCRMGKELRRPEEEAVLNYCVSQSVKILGKIEAPGLLEGGDIVWLNERTLAVGLGYRTNPEGIRQLKELCAEHVDKILPVPLPHFRGPQDVLHLMSLISPLARRTAVVFKKLLSVPFLKELSRQDYHLIEIDENEFDALACNVLALSPELVLMADGAPTTKGRIEKSGFEVLTYAPSEISLKGQGGPTCLTRPLVRK